MCDPSGKPADGEHHGEHVERNPDRPKNDARVKVDVGIELSLNELFVRQRDLGQLAGDIE